MPEHALPRFAELQAPPSWRTVEFISDLHLQATEPRTFEAWRGYMASCRADALFILGDLFEVWIGDDVLDEPGFAADCAAVLQATARRMPLFLMHGNRDFLVGDGLLRSCGATLLDDPTVFTLAGQRWLLTHGDALCVSDTKYMQFREMVRNAQWQREFLGKPLAERIAIGRATRTQSEENKRAGAGIDYGEVDDALAAQWLDAADAPTMIHGHTHKPREHDLGGGRTRMVLTDWDLEASPPRREVLRVSASGAQRIPLA
ncbi:MAG TPA: UDP-2,3-diacylglucosamine diphosphatase [Ramlibacter sp.]|nr:UDP-2,3-diacylglucosamine diphosphatase [Ramlibacter sp.]